MTIKLLCIQLQPALAPELNLEFITNYFEKLQSNSFVESLSISEGNDDGPYVNIICGTYDLKSLWTSITQELYKNRNIGPALSDASIVTCQGNKGWDDYLLLFHFNKKEPLDSLTK